MHSEGERDKYDYNTISLSISLTLVNYTSPPTLLKRELCTSFTEKCLKIFLGVALKKNPKRTDRSVKIRNVVQKM